TQVSEISRLGRNTQGVTLMRLGDEEQLIGMARIAVSDEEGEDAEGAAEDSAGQTGTADEGSGVSAD
ncbi:MAG: DNA gyrase C-terminal beta-propeller domain-containing protein, partial [Wenzhouxiangellaceae bacterium]|nr:DNA gyrase C-terminal beta-propeller domain-containing protein [Wenzhouxiangellaceae bacterium]